MATYVQADRPMTVTTPLGKDALLLVGFSGQEAISELFSFQLELLAENKTEVPFDKLLGQKITVNLSLVKGKKRAFNGICSRVTQGERDEVFTSYQMELVPQFWLLTRRVQSRIFQHLTVVEILKKVLAGLEVAYEIQGTFHPRDFCVQYQESDFAFASRLMEEEGIFYFFKHTGDGHKMVLGNTALSHPDMPDQSRAIFETVLGGTREEFRVHEWQKAQELRSGKYTLWDHCFELPHKHLEVDQTVLEAVPVGKVTHKLKVAGNDKLEIYHFPGGYAQRFDGVDKAGAPKPADLEKIFEDNKRTVAIRMLEEAGAGLAIHGAGNCRPFVTGHKFTLERHFNADGQYLLTGLQHSAKLAGDFRSGGQPTFHYSNRFTCLPLALPFRPPRTTPRPRVQGTQTAVVVGPPGEEIFTDKYGRVKVQFHWDREGKNDADSSCWIRVATIWAGKGWGIVNVPRIGHEVIVDFLEGDPDNPIIIGSVFNADHMPADELPKTKMVSGLKSNSTPGGGGYNGLIFNDTKKKEMVTFHAQKDLTTVIEHDESHTLNTGNRTIKILTGTHTESIKGDTGITIVSGKYSHTVAANTASHFVKGAVDTTYMDKFDFGVVGPVAETFMDTQSTTVKNAISIDSTAADVTIHGATQIKLFSGKSSITLFSSGDIEIAGENINIAGKVTTKIGTGNQTFSSDTSAAAVSGSNVSVGGDGTGKVEVKGGVIKLN
jgi:type VI secretion system secreted protein VgrG